MPFAASPRRESISSRRRTRSPLETIFLLSRRPAEMRWGQDSAGLHEVIPMFTLKVIAIVFGVGLVLSQFTTFGTDEACVLLAALFG
jgi:hypothetical protein